MNIKQSILSDSADNYTPDLTSMRFYGEAIPVFIWDTLRSFRAFKDRLPRLIEYKDYRTMWFSAETTGTGVVFENKDKFGNAYSHYLLTNKNDIEQVSLTGTKSLPIGGHLIHCNLKALTELDFHYGNGYNFTRTKIQIRNKFSKKIATVYAYINNANHLTYFEDGVTEFYEGIDLVEMEARTGVSYQVY